MSEKAETIYSFVFKGLLTEEALDKNGSQKPGKFSEETEKQVAERLSLNLIDDDHVVPARKMAVVFTAITAFENSVRELITKVLSDEKGESWWDSSVSEKIRKKAESRKDQEDKIRWHTPRGQSLIYYTELGDLVSILQNNWEFFEDYLHSFEWAKNIIITLEKSRNVIMHGGQLDMTDIERIGTSIRDWIRQIGS
jgi:hypothetical protein